MPDWRDEVRRRARLEVPPDRESEAVDELAQHLADRYRDALDRGLSEERARAAALAELEPLGGGGPPARPRRPRRRSTMIEELGRDIRHGLRLMARAPGFTAVVVATLALAIGANTAVFSLVNAVLLRPLPFPDAARLAVVTESLPSLGFPVLPFSAPDFEDYARGQRSFLSLAPYNTTEHDLAVAGGEAERIRSARVGAGLFDVLGVAPLRGRVFTAEEDRPGSAVALISHGLWQRRFGGADPALGATLHLDRAPHTVVGIMPAGFQFPLRGPRINGEPADVWVPIAFTPEQRETRGQQHNHTVIGRLAPGATLEQAAAEANTLALRIEQSYPARLREFLRGHLALPVTSLREQVVGHSRAPLLLLLGAVVLVLLVACANVANLLLARGTARQQELALRAALGAGRWRLVRQSAAESLALAVVGGFAGLLLAEGLRQAGVLALPLELPLVDHAGLDGRVLAATLVGTLASALLFGIAPGLVAASGTLNTTLRQGARGGTSPALRRALRGFAVAQFAGALVLLTVAGLLLRSFSALVRTDPGFQPQQAVALSLYLPPRGYPARADILAFQERLLERLAALPGLQTLGASSDLPLAPRERRAITIEGGLPGDNTTPPVTTQSWVMGDYFRATGIPLRAGRRFDPRDREGAPPVVIVSESLARRFWPGQDALGKRLRWGGETNPWLTVVGIVGEVKDGLLQEEANPHTYTPMAQEGPREIEGFLRNVNVVLRAQGEPPPLMTAVRREVASLDAGLAVADLRVLTEDLRAAVAPQRFQLTVVAAFAGLGLVLAAVGIYGILAHFVGQQTREIGVRMALGARASDVLRGVVGEGVRLAAVGAVVGLGLSLAAARLLRGLLFGVGTYDVPAFLAAPAVLGLVALVACALPAWRAARVDPVVALRQD